MPRQPRRRKASAAAEAVSLQEVSAQLQAQIDPKMRYLQAVGLVRDLLLAAEVAQLPWADVQGWIQKEKRYRDQVELHQGLYLARLEFDLIALGKLKKNPMPLLAALNAHSCEYGTLKRPFLDKIFAKFVKAVVKELKGIAPAPLLKQLGTVLDREAQRAVLSLPG